MNSRSKFKSSRLWRIKSGLILIQKLNFLFVKLALNLEAKYLILAFGLPIVLPHPWYNLVYIQEYLFEIFSVKS